jgi:predicted DNA-binding transcriptional regulator YafY
MATRGERFGAGRRYLSVVNELLSGKTCDRRSVVASLGVRPATADRILRAIERFLPLVQRADRGRTRRIFFDPAFVAGRPSKPMVVAACFGSSLSNLFHGSAYDIGMRHALEFVLKGSKSAREFHDVDRKFFFVAKGGETALPERHGDLDEIIEALLRCEIVSAQYQNFEGRRTRLRFRPLSLVLYDHQIYVVGENGRGTRIPFRFSRLSDVERTNQTFTYPPAEEFDPAALFTDSFGVFVGEGYPVSAVVVHLAPRWGHFAHSHHWHRSQRVRVRQRHVEVSLRVRVCPELEAWILGFGEEARVVRPQWLRKRVESRIIAAAERLPVASLRTRPIRPSPVKRTGFRS